MIIKNEKKEKKKKNSRVENGFSPLQMTPFAFPRNMAVRIFFGELTVGQKFFVENEYAANRHCDPFSAAHKE